MAWLPATASREAMAPGALPLVVWLAGLEGYDDSLAWFKRWLLLPTLVYFVASTIWQLRRMKRNA